MSADKLLKAILPVLNLIGILVTFYMVPDNTTRIILCSLFVGLLAMTGVIYFSGNYLGVNAGQILKTCKKLGITKIYPSASYDQVSERISSSNRIRIIGIAPYTLIHNFQNQFVNALSEKHAEFYILVLDPALINTCKHEEIENIRTPKDDSNTPANPLGHLGLLDRIETDLVTYLEVAKEKVGVSGVCGRIFIGYYRTNFRNFLVLCNEDWGWLNICVPPVRSLQTCSLEMVNAEGGLLNDCNKHYESIWQSARKFELFPNSEKIEI